MACMGKGEGKGDNVDEKRLMLNVVSVRGRRWGRMRLTFTNSRNIALTHTHTHTHTPLACSNHSHPHYYCTHMNTLIDMWMHRERHP